MQKGIQSPKDEYDGWIKKIERGDWGDWRSLRLRWHKHKRERTSLSSFHLLDMRHHTMRKLPPLLPPASQYFADAISYQIAANEEVLATTNIPGLGSCQFDAIATILAATGVRTCSGWRWW